MLINFKAKNYRSIGEELVLSMIATADNSLPQNLIDVPKYGIKLLKTMAIFGGNGAGKSNILSAMEAASNLVTVAINPNSIWIKEAYKPNKNKLKDSIEFSFDLLLKGTAYCYSFAYLADKITFEKLVKYPDNESEEIIYEGKSQDSLELTTKSNPDFALVYSWFENNNFQKQIKTEDLLSILGKKKQKALLLKCLAVVDLGIQDITSKNFEIKIHKKSGEFDFFTEESSGIQQFIGKLASWLTGSKNATFFADEFGNSLHPLLTRLMVKFFYSEKTNKNQSQFIFTTHEVKLMEYSLIRLDQILLVDKNDDGNSVVKRCSDYTEISRRKDQYARFDNLYLNGGTRGLPYIPDFFDFDDIF